jgi:hypothetical protein
MTASVSSPADLVNVALRRIGYRLRVGNLYDGSEAANLALDIYGQTRDELMRQNDFGFAERSAALTLLKSAPAQGYIPPTVWDSTYPPLPWAYEYAYPGDCLKVRSIIAAPLFLFNPDPTPNLFEIANDTANGTVQRVILANVPSAIAIYTGRVTDPASWDVDFTEAFAAALGERLVPLLGNLNAIQVMKADEMQTLATAEREQG